MIKKYTKLFIVGIVAFLVSILPTSAKTMTLTELEQEIVNKNPDVTDIYIIGNYAFTDQHILKIQDMMLAARSITTEATGKTDQDPIFDAMTINYISRSIDSKTFEYSDWTVNSNIYGKTTINANTTLNINYIDYEIVKQQTEFNISLYDSAIAGQNWNGNYKGEANTNKNKLTLSDNGTLEGLILRESNVTADPKTNYYFAFQIAIDGYRKGETTIDIDGKTYTIENGDKLALLYSLNPDAVTKNITILVDLDGNGDEYEATQYVINWDNVILQNSSKASLSTDIPDSELLDLKDNWGYEKYQSDTYKFDPENSLNFQGTVVEHTLLDRAFGQDEKTGYFITFNVKPENITDDITITIPCKSCEGGTKTLTKKDLVEDSLTVIFKVSKENEPKEIKIVVDADGKSDVYESVTYTISYEDLNFAKDSNFTVQKVERNDAAASALNSAYSWNIPKIYETEFNQNGNNIKVTGQISKTTALKEGIFNKNELTGYYLGLVVKVDDTLVENTSTVTVANGKIIKKGFDDNGKALYLLKHLQLDTDNSFDIIVDIDGDGNEYAPHLIHIDLSELSLEADSYVNNIDVLTNDTLTDLTKSEYESYQYDITLNDTTISKVDNSNYTLSGKVKEQPLVNAFSGSTKSGYYVPLRIQIPTEFIADATFKINTSKDGETYKIIDNKEIENGYLNILFAIYKDGANGKKITFEVDLDGEDKNEYLYSPITIDYSTVTFAEEVNVTYNYGNDVKEVIKAHVGDVLEAPSLDEIAQNKPFHEVNGWYTADAVKYEFDGENNRIKEDKDLELTAHWYLNLTELLNLVVQEYDLVDDKLNIKLADDVITYELIEEDIPLTQFSNNLFPAIIKYVLDEDEISDITLSYATSDVSKKFTASDDLDSIKASIADFLNSVLTTSEGKNMDDLTSYAFTLKISDTLKSENVKFKEGTKTSYTIKFEGLEHVNVRNESELKNALEGDKKVIIIQNDFNVESVININRDVIIKSEKNKKYTITSNDQDYVFNVTSGVVDIYDVNLTGAKTGVKVGSTSQVSLNNIDLSNNTKAGVEVEGTFQGIDLVYSNENHDTPIVKVLEAYVDTAKVSINKTSGKYLKKIDNHSKYSQIIKHDSKWCSKPSKEAENCAEYSWSDEKIDSQNVYYYLNNDNNTIYYIGFMDIKGGFMRYRLKGEAIDAPTDYDLTYVYNGKTYYATGYYNMRYSYAEGRFDRLVNLENQIVDESIMNTYTKWFFMSYLEKDFDVTINSKSYNTYKFTDLDHMTISQLMTYNKDFKAAFEALEKEAVDGKKIYNDGEEVTRETVIDKNLTLTVK